MPAFGDLFKSGGVVEQIAVWQVLGQVLQPILAPVVQEIASQVNARAPDVPLSPAEAAELVLKGWIDRDTGAGIAGETGISGQSFDRLVQVAGEPISIEQALFLLRRGKIDRDRVVHAIRESRVRDEWVDAVLALATQPITAGDAVAAAVQNQISRDQAAQIAFENGLERADFDILVNTRGRPPGPEQVIEMVRRGVVPATGVGPGATSLEQAIHESDIKDKWSPLYQALLEYRPPPRTVTALLRAGAITSERALALFRDAGLSAELAAAYVADASHQKLAPAKELARTTVTQLYDEHVIAHDQAAAMLGSLGYDEHEAGFLLALVDLQRVVRVQRAALARIGTLYVGRRLERPGVIGALDALGIPHEQRDQLLVAWDLERQSTLRVPSPATIASAVFYNVISVEDGIAELQAQGYTAYDAWLELSVRSHGPLGTPPAKDATHGVL